MSDSTIKLQIGEASFAATLADNSSARALRARLARGPLKVRMRDYGNMEKVGFVRKLPRNDEQISAQPGDLILYLGRLLVIYYAPNSWNFTRLGRIDDVSAADLKAALGTGKVTVTLSIG